MNDEFIKLVLDPASGSIFQGKESGADN
jgi:hypothetical protein